MWIAHPSRHYLYYRLSRNADSIDKILGDFRDLGLAIPLGTRTLDDFIRKLLRFRREHFLVPSGFNPLAKPLSRPTLDFLKKWKIHGMWLREEMVARAEDLLHVPSVRFPLDVMLLGPIQPSHIAERLKRRYDLPDAVMNPAVVRAYAHYFWDYGALTLPQWSDTIYNWFPAEDKTALLSALHAPRTPAGAALVMSVADGSLDTVPASEMFDTVRAMGFRMFMQHALFQGASLSRTQGALAAFQIMQGAGAEADKYRGGDSDLVKEFDRIEQQYDTVPQAHPQISIGREALALPETGVIDTTAEETTP